MSNGVSGAERSNLVDLDELRKEVEDQSGEVNTWKYENGRRYATTGHYYLPNDEPEIQRLKEQHWLLTQVKGGELHKAPLPLKKDGAKVLDIGCGSGIWCTQMAEFYPDAEIVGMDLSNIQPEDKPSNVEWIVHDMEKEWPFPEQHFDFVHLSLVHGCVANWNRMMETIVQHLAPGGYVEHQEYSLCRQYFLDANGNKIPLTSNIDDLPPLLRWGRLMEQGAERRGRPLQLGTRLADFQSSAGLQEVNESIYNISVGTWPADKQQKFLGGHMLLNALQGLEGFSTIMFTKALGWSLEATQEFVEQVKTQLRDDSVRKVMDFHVVYGQKPIIA